MKTENELASTPTPKTIVNAAFHKLAPLLESEKMAENIPGHQKSLERMNFGLFRLVVMGEIKKGKSSFVNALVEEPELLPTDVDIATSTVYKLIYGPKKRFKVFFHEDPDTGKSPIPVEIEPSQLVDYGTEKGNPDNLKCVDFIGIELPSPLLKDGLCIIDTPGVGGLYKAHRDITWRYAPNADAVFFILDSAEAVLSSDEILFLKELTEKVTQRVYFAQTKIDAADLETVQTWEKRNKDLLVKEVGISEKAIRYFPVSSVTKQKADKTHSGKRLVRSGFPPLLHFLHHVLMPGKDDELARDAAQLLLSSAARLENALKERNRIFCQKTDEEAKDLQKKFEEAKKRFAEWGKETFPKVVNNFSAEFDTIRRSTRRTLRDELSPHGETIPDILKSLEGLDASTLVSEAENAGKKLIAQTAELSVKVTRKFATDSQKLAYESISELAADSQFSIPEFEVENQEEFKNISTSMNLDSAMSGWDKMREVVTGASIGSAILGAAASLVFPTIGIAAIIGGLAGGGQIAYNNAEDREKKHLLNELERKLRDKLLRVREKALDDFEEKAVSFHRQFQDLLTDAKEGRERELAERMADLSESRKLDLSQRKEKSRSIKSSQETVRGIILALQSVFPAND